MCRSPVQQNLCSGDHCAGSDSGRHAIELAPDAAASCSAVFGPAASLSPMLSLASTYSTCVPPLVQRLATPEELIACDYDCVRTWQRP